MPYVLVQRSGQGKRKSNMVTRVQQDNHMKPIKRTVPYAMYYEKVNYVLGLVQHLESIIKMLRHIHLLIKI